jgi:hypothetical protein
VFVFFVHFATGACLVIACHCPYLYGMCACMCACTTDAALQRALAGEGVASGGRRLSVSVYDAPRERVKRERRLARQHHGTQTAAQTLTIASAARAQTNNKLAHTAKSSVQSSKCEPTTALARL